MCGSWPPRGQCSQTGSPGKPWAVQWLGLRTFTAEGPDWILVGELKSHKPCDAVGKKKKKDWQPYEGRDNVAILLLNPLPLELRGR